MEKKRLNLEDLKGQNPFRVPEGYMEGLTDQIMSQLPEKTSHTKQTRKVTKTTRLLPWVSIAAAIVGIGFFIKVFIDTDNQINTQGSDSIWRQAQMPAGAISQAAGEDDYFEYMEYLETVYSDYILEEEMAYSD